MSTAPVVVVGSGPAGAAAARECLRLGCGPVIVLERNSRPWRKPCGGGLSPGAIKQLRRLGMWPAVQPHCYPIRSLRLVTPGGQQYLLGDRETAAVIDRLRLDELLRRQLRRAGAQLREGIRVRSIEPLPAGPAALRLDCGEFSITAARVILACGSRSPLVHRPTRGRLLHGCSQLFAGVEHRPHTVEMIYWKDIVPHYGWLFPLGRGQVDIGICLAAQRPNRSSPRRLLEQFLERYYAERLKNARPLGPVGFHPIAWNGPAAGLAAGVLPVGEAAGLSNPATGEGMLHALWSGRLAARLVAWSLRTATGPQLCSRLYRTLQAAWFEPRRHLAGAYLAALVPRLERTAAWLHRRGLTNLVGQSLAHL